MNICKCGKPRDRRSKSGLCKVCFRANQIINRKPKLGGSQYKLNGKSHYERHKTKYLQRVKYRKKTARTFILHIKAGGKCVDCGNPDFRVLDFDHVRGDKLYDISKMPTFGISIRSIMEEVNKCELRCANCHRIRHYEDNKN